MVRKTAETHTEKQRVTLTPGKNKADCGNENRSLFNSPNELSSNLIIDPCSEQHYDLILSLAGKYVWWQEPQKAVQDPCRVLAAAMNLGTLEDYRLLIKKVGRPVLREVLRQAAPGWFSPKAWSFWHRSLDMVPVSSPVPPPPERKF